MKTTTVFELTQDYLKVVQASLSKKGAMITSAESLPIAGMTDEDITKNINGLRSIRAARRKDNRVVVIIPRQYAILRYLHLPSTDLVELRKMVDLQAVNHIPYAREDVSVDFIVLSSGSDGFSKVAVIVIPIETLMRYWNVFAGARLSIGRMTLSSIGLWQWYSAQSFASNQTVALLDIDEGMSEICFCDKDRLWTSRHISLGVSQLEQGQYAEFLKQMDLTLAGYQKEKLGATASKVIICSSMEYAEELRRKMEEEFSVEVQSIRFFEKVRTVKNMQWPKAVLGGQVSLTGICGIALNPDSLDFIPVEVKESREKKLRNRQLVRVGALGAVALVAVTFALSLGFIKKNAYLQSIEVEIKTTKKQVTQVEKLMQQMATLRGALDGRIIFVEVIDEIYRIMPDNIALVNLALSNGNTLSLQGFTPQGSDINQLQKSMVDLEIFENVNLDYVNKRTTQEGEMNYFKITCQITPSNK